MTTTASSARRDETCFFPDRLMKRMAGLSSHAVAVVEAPSGFGKTTAVREFLRRAGGEARLAWYTCFGEQPLKAWERMVRLFEAVDPEAAEGLQACLPRTPEDLARLAEIMRGCRCDGETYIVIDNYQLFECDLSGAVPSAFAAYPGENLHTVFITQPLPFSEFPRSQAGILRLGTGDFFFDRESTARLCRLKGARMTERELDRVQSVTEGWVSAILLQASVHRETGVLADARDMDSLIGTAVWNRLADVERDFLLSLSLLGSFTTAQAAIMSGAAVLPDRLRKALDANFFIQYVSDKGVYSMHSILADYLASRLDARPAEQARLMRRRAATACAQTGDYLEAAGLLVEAGDYAGALSLPLASSYLNDQKEGNMTLLLERIVDASPEDILLDHPFAILTFAFQFMKTGDAARFARLLSLLQSLQASPPDGLSESELSRLRGETALLLSFTEFNDIARMSARHREAAEHLDSSGEGASRTVVFGSTPWTFGLASVLCLYWRKSGELDAEMELMDDCLPVYLGLSGGHGAGADSVMRAEAHLLRGEGEAAESAAYKGMYFAKASGQTSIALCAELVLARLRILRGDGPGFVSARANIERYRQESRSRSVLRMVDLCLATLDLILGDTGDLPDWLRTPEGIRRALYVQGQPCGLALYARILLAERRYPELYAITEQMMEIPGGPRFMLPLLTRRIIFAAACADEGKYEEAAENLGEALDMALPDRVRLSFAEITPPLARLIDREVRGRDGDSVAAIVALCERQARGADAVRKCLRPRKEVLTDRESEIAQLAKDGLRTREIAARLYISENTVKSALKKVFVKLKVRSRNELARKEF